MPALSLYADAQFTSPYVLSVFVTLHEKKLPFTMHKIDLDAQQNLQADYRKLSLNSKVPSLHDGDFQLSESSAICEYLEECYPAPDYASVYPRDLRQRAQARQIQAWLRSDFLPLRAERSTNVIFFKPNEAPLSEAAQASAAKLIAAADSLLTEEAGHLFGDWCIADTDLTLMLNRLILNGDPVPEKLVSYAKHQWQRPSVQLWLAQTR